MEVLGSGIDGVVVFPPVECDKMNSIEPNDFVGKIHFRGKTFEEVKSRIDALPDEYDGILYYKENYLCDIVLPDELKIKYKNKLSDSQLILKRVDGETLQNMLDNCVINNDGCRFFELLKSSINAYYIIKELAEKNVFYNDYKCDNVIVDRSGRLILIDLDAISYGTPTLTNIRLLPRNLTSYHVEGNTAYKLWHSSYIKSIIEAILTAMFDAYYSPNDEYIFDTFDEPTKIDFIKRKTEFEKIINKPYTKLDYTDIDNIRDNLDILQRICCEGAKGNSKRNKKTKTKKSKKIKKSKKLKRTIRRKI
jgi:hypothetical protein